MSKVEDNNWVFEEKEEKDYSVEISSFDRVKPVGVSGLLRIKNDADFVAESIDSCIEALDELVITYQDSVDNTLDRRNNIPIRLEYIIISLKSCLMSYLMRIMNSLPAILWTQCIC